MAHDGLAKEFVGEINGQAERDRRSLVLRRHEIYRDAGKRFIIEQLVKEFGSTDAIKEMRLAPINVLKKIVNKKSQVYKESPVRTTPAKSDQELMDHYVQMLNLDGIMQKANRYYNLHANTQIYVKPHPRKDGTSEIRMHVIPPHLYSVKPSPLDLNTEKVIAFSPFTEERMTTSSRDTSPVGPTGFDRERSLKSGARDLVESNEKKLSDDRHIIFWTDEAHFTTDNDGVILFDPAKDDTQFENPIGRIPSVNLAKDRDNEYWAKQGEDLVDMSLALQLGLSDILTIIKTHGFSIMTIVSAEEPSKIHIGITKGIWLKQTQENPNPKVEFAQAASPIAENMDALLAMLRLLLTTNDMTPGTVSGSDTAKVSLSGFSQIIEMSDTLMAVQADQPILKSAELDAWDIIKLWHNWLFDQGLLDPESKLLGRFSDQFDPNISYPDVKPIESRDEKLGHIEREDKLGLLTKKDMFKILDPDMKDDAIDSKIKEIEEEKSANVERMQKVFGGNKDGEENIESDQESDRPPGDSRGNPFDNSDGKETDSE